MSSVHLITVVWPLNRNRVKIFEFNPDADLRFYDLLCRLNPVMLFKRGSSIPFSDLTCPIRDLNYTVFFALNWRTDSVRCFRPTIVTSLRALFNEFEQRLSRSSNDQALVAKIRDQQNHLCVFFK